MARAESNSFQSLQERSGPTLERHNVWGDKTRWVGQPSSLGLSTPQIETPIILASPELQASAPHPAANTVPSGSVSVAVQPLPAQNGGDPPQPIVVLPRRMPSPSGKYRAIQRWEGTVLSTTTDGFHALLRDLDNVKPEERTFFSFGEIEPDDYDLVTTGAVFYWYVGYQTTAITQRKLTVNLRFRRLPAWTKSQVDHVQREARRLETLFGKRASSATGTTSS